MDSHEAVSLLSVLIISRHTLIREGLKAMISDMPFRAMFEWDTVESAVTQSLGSVELILIGQTLGNELVEPFKMLRVVYPHARIVCYSPAVNLPMKTLTGLFGSSLDGCLLSNSPPHALRQSLDLIMMGESVFPFSLLMSSFPAEADPISAEPTIVNESFSMRELQVLAILQNGKSNKTIAREVGLSEATIKVHIKNVLRKLGASNRTEAAIWMMKHQNLLQDTEYLPALPERDHHSMADVLAHEDF